MSRCSGLGYQRGTIVVVFRRDSRRHLVAWEDGVVGSGSVAVISVLGC
jgi:hypothetical protein